MSFTQWEANPNLPGGKEQITYPAGFSGVVQPGVPAPNAPPVEPSPPPAELPNSQDLAWLLATGQVRGDPVPPRPVTMMPATAGAVSGLLVAVTFPGGYTVSLPWVGEPPANGSVVLVAQVGQARIVIGQIGGPDDAAIYALISALDTRVTTAESDIVALQTADDSLMYVENVAPGLHFYWTGGVVSKTADGSGNCSINFGEPGTPFSYPVAPITAWCIGASGGAPIVPNIGALNIGSLDLHLSGLEGTVVPGNTFSLAYGVLGY